MAPIYALMVLCVIALAAVDGTVRSVRHWKQDEISAGHSRRHVPRPAGWEPRRRMNY
jgi:hypothetical protein